MPPTKRTEFAAALSSLRGTHIVGSQTPPSTPSTKHSSPGKLSAGGLHSFRGWASTLSMAGPARKAFWCLGCNSMKGGNWESPSSKTQSCGRVLMRFRSWCCWVDLGQCNGRMHVRYSLGRPYMKEVELRTRLLDLLNTHRTGALGTLSEQGWPYVSMTPFAVDFKNPSLLIHVSELGAHTRYLLNRPQASFMVCAREEWAAPVH